jgi:hypothetical protein
MVRRMFSGMFWLLVALPFAVMLVWLWWWRRGIDRRKERVPATLTLLRPPGESLRLKIDMLDEKLSEHLFFAIAFPAGFAIAHGASGANGLGVALVFAVLSGAVIGYFGRKAIRTATELRNVRLGWHGERACGEELNRLMLQGCQVFHDVPNAPYGNIDHVIVAPTGVYGVETKTRRMRKMPDQREDHVVTSDGKSLRFPFGTETRSIEQAEQQASRLQTFLSSAVGEAVTVTPILAVPGWFVRRTSLRGIPVINPKSARHVVLDRKKPRVDPVLLKRVAHQLDQRCRDVTL